MIIGNISFTVTGNVSLVIQGKRLSKSQIQERLDLSIKDGFNVCPNYTNDVYSITSECIKSLPLTQATFDSIISGELSPSYATRKEHNLNVKTPKGFALDKKKWKGLSEIQRVWLYYIDHAVDFGAISHSVHFN